MHLSALLPFPVNNKASALPLSAGRPPMIRVNGDVRRINLPPMEHKDVHARVYDIMNDAQRKHYEENLEGDFSFAIPNSVTVKASPKAVWAPVSNFDSLYKWHPAFKDDVIKSGKN